MNGYLIQRVHEHAQKTPQKKALIWVDSKGNDQESYTYAQFEHASKRLATALLQDGIKRGDTAVLAYTPCLDFYIAFWACMHAGIVAVPVNPPFSDSDVKKFLRIVNNSNATVVLTDKLFARLLTMKIRKHKARQVGKGIASIFGRNDNSQSFTFGDMESLWWITTSGMSSNHENPSLKPQPPEDTAFIMYSSGSTSAPKGALTTFVNLKHQFELIEEALESNSEHVACWWAPHFHDFGLISGFLNSLHQGCKSVITSPMYFIQRPAIWLDMMHSHKATHTFGPDFGYLLLVNKTSQEEREVEKWDLSHLKVAMSAAEKVRYATLKAFTDAFACCGFRPQTFCPAYGLAEHAVGVTINSLLSLPQVLNVQRSELEQRGEVITRSKTDDATRLKQLVGSGSSWNETDVRIVLLNDEGEPQKEAPRDQVGEIWVSSLSKTLGYHKLPDATREVFEARLPGVDPKSADGQREFLRTGDLGFLSSENGELFVCGRNKDMIIIAGKNHYSEDMELNIAENLQGFLRPGCIATLALEHPDSGQEELCVVAEATALNIDRETCFRSIQECIAREHHISVSKIALITPKTIPKTSSGKIRRFLVKDMLEKETLKFIDQGIWVNPQAPVSAPEDPAPQATPVESPAPQTPPAKTQPTPQDEPLRTVPVAVPQPKSESEPKALVPAAPKAITEGRESDFPKLLLDFRNFASSKGSPAAFPVYFPECGEGFSHWYFLVGTEHLATLFDEDKFYRMPVWNFTSPAPEIFNENNFPRWANGDLHRKMKSRLSDIVQALIPTTVSRTKDTTNRFLDRWTAKSQFPWLPEFNEFTTALFCEVFTGKMLPEAPDLFTTVLYGVDPFRKNSFESQEVTREDNVAQGFEAKRILGEFIAGSHPSQEAQLDADLLVGSGGFAVIPALKNVLINLYATLSSEPEIRQRLLEELRALPQPIEKNSLTENTPLLEACIYEIIRMHPPVGHYYARAREDMVVNGLHIPKDSNVVGHTWYSYHDPSRFKNPDLFDPDRFLPPRNEHLDTERPFDPFGSGDPLNGHACPGQELAMLLVRTVMAQSLLEYDWELEKPAWDDTNFRERYGVPNYEDGMKVTKFRKRTDTELDEFFRPNDTQKSLTLKELRHYDGSEAGRPLYIAVLGKIYDVSESADFYGAGGPYEIFAGRDASRALATMSLEPESVDNPTLEGLKPDQEQMLHQWDSRLAAKYAQVGLLRSEDIKPVTKLKRPKLEAPLSWRVAVVGGGVSGLAAALALSEYGYKVSVFEKNMTLGGHACTKPVGAHMRQPAFGMFMEKQWPNVFALLNKVGVEPIVECTGNSAIRHFAHDGHTIPVDSIQEEATRFYYHMADVINDPEADGTTIGAFFKDQGYSQQFICYYFVGKVIHYFAGQSLEYYLSYPLRLIAWMYLGITGNESDHVVRVDNDQYMRAIKDLLQSRRVQIIQNTDVEFVSRNNQKAVLSYNGGTQSFGHVVLAVQPHHALNILGPCATTKEEDLLSQFEYTVDTAILHFDDSWVPKNQEDWGLLNYMLPDEGEPLPDPGDTIPITTPFLSDTDGKTPIFCTYNYANAHEWDGDGPHWKYTFEHTRVTPATQLLRRDLQALQGKQLVHFSGSWSRGLTLHEDAVVTGLQAANRILGIDRQFPLQKSALPQAAPFQNAEDELGTSVDEIVLNLGTILRELTTENVPLTVDTDLLALGLSSLDIARLVNAVNARLSSETIAVEEFYALDTLGEVAEQILALNDSDPIYDELGHSPMLSARASGGKVDNAVGMAHPVSFSQHGILMNHFVAMQRSSDWNISLPFWLNGLLDVNAMLLSFLTLSRRHSVFRTTFRLMDDGSFSQRINSHLSQEFFSIIEVQDSKEAVALAKAEFEKPMDITKTVFRINLYTSPDEQNLITIVLHHAISDGWSLGNLVTELRELYAGYEAGRSMEDLDLPHLPIQFVDYAYWQRDYHKHHHYDSHVAYWKKELHSPLPILKFPRPNQAATGKSHTGRSHTFKLSEEHIQALRDQAAAWRTSLNVIFLAAYAHVLARLCGQQEVLVHVPVAGRQHETEALIGCFADAMILRVAGLAQQGFREVVAAAHKTLYDGLKHSAPLALVVNELEASKTERANIHRAILLWEQTVTLQNQVEKPFGKLKIEPLGKQESGTADMQLYAHSSLALNASPEGGMQCEWQFKDGVLDPNAANKLTQDFQDLLEKSTTAVAEQAPAQSVDAQPSSPLQAFSSRKLFSEGPG